MKTVKTFGTFKKFLKPFTVLFTAGLLISFLYSCEIGLGGAVDTQPPKITITNPPVDAVIRDNFAICGTYDDDGTIKSVSAVLTRPDKKGKDIELTEFTLTGDANIKGAGTWTIPVNALDAQGTKLIADGTYQASITIKDAAGRSTLQNTTFTVDNTAPLLILQRPATDISVINEDDIDTFGKTFTLEGRAADDNNIDHIDIKIFSDPQKTDLIHTVTLQNVPLSIALDVAKWGEENQNYEKIYGSSTQEGAKKRYCSIEAYDSAQRYPADGTEQTAEDKNGNRTNDYYLYNDIAGSSIANYKVTDLYSIMSGNYTSDGRSATDTISSVKAVLNSLKKDSGCFKLNPLNNPTYKLSGWTSTEDFITFEDSSITIDVEPGLDGIAVDKTTLKPYLIKIDDSGNPVSGKIYPDSEDVKITGASSYKIAVKINRKKAKNAAGNDITYTYGTYLVGVEGFDKSEGTPNELMPDNLPIGSQGYKIDIQNVGAAPDLTVNYVVNDVAATENIIYLPKNKIDTDTESEITINCTVEDTKEEVPEFQILLDEQSLGVSKSDLVKDTVNSNDDKFIYTFTRKIKLSQIPGFDTAHSKQHTITVTTSNGSPTSDKKTFMYDVEGPVVEIRSVTPVASIYDLESGEPTDSIKYLNGENIEISVSFADSFDVVDTSIRKPKIEFVQGNTVKTIADGITELSYKKTGVSTKMTGLTEGDVIIRVTAYDRAGNKTTKEESYKIDQTTDSPVIIYGDNSVNNSWSDISSNTPGRKNVFNMGGQFLLKLVDDDGLSSYSVYSVKTSNGSGSKADDPNPDTATINGKESQFAWTLPTEAGTHKVWLDVTDTERNTTSKEFFIKVVSGMPIVSIENERYVTTVTDAAALTNNASKSPLKIKLSIEASEGPFDIYMAEVTAQNADPAYTDATPIITNLAATEYTYNYPIDSNKADGEYKLKFFVVDNSGGNTGVKITSYKLDKTAPVISTVAFDGEENEQDWYKTVTIALSVQASDGNNTARSDISTVEYSLDNDTWTALTKRDEAYIRTVTFANGANTLYLRAIDNVGNVGKWQKNLNIDETAPEFTINSDNYIYLNKTTATQPLVLTGTFKDEESGVGELTVKIDGQNASVTNTNGNWTATFTKNQIAAAFPKDENDKVINSMQALTISGANTCGTPINPNAIPNITVMMDIDDPYLQNIDIKSDTTKGVYKKSDTEYFIGTNLGNTFTISGIAKDETSGIQKVTCKVGNASPVETTSAGWSFPINLGSTDGSSKDIVLTVYDNAGNLKENATIKVTVDNTAPKGLHLMDSKDKNLVFRIGQQDNDDIAPGDSLWSDSLDKDVGGKYSHGTFGNSTTIQVRGTFEEAATASGISMIYYKVYTDEPASSTDPTETFETLKADVLANYIGRISPITAQDKLAAEERRVFYNVKQVNGVPDESVIYEGSTQLPNSLKNGYYKYYKNIRANFNETISGFTEGQNFLVLVAVDNVGNAAVDVAKVKYNGTDTYFPCYSLNVDKQPPSSIVTRKEDGTAASGIIYSNGSNTIPLWGTVSDIATDVNARSGIRSFVLSRDGVNTTVPAILRAVRTQADAQGNPADPAAVITLADSDPTLKIWEVNDISSLLPSSDGTVSISATATDNAGTGNTTPGVVATVTVDTTAPTITVNLPDDADASTSGTQVNGTISISGTAEDNNVVSGTEAIYIKQQAENPGTVTKNTTQAQMTSAGWTKLTATGSGISNWSFSGIDTTNYDDGTTWFTVAIKDVAGNIAYSTPQSIVIAQDSDRPVITVSQISKNTLVTLRIKNVYGSLNDDDGNIQKLWYWYTQKQDDPLPTEAPTENDNKGWTPITVSGGSWSTDSTEDDGETTWYFAVQDAKGKIFYTNASNALYRPYIKYTDINEKQDNEDGVKFMYDTNPPTVTSLELYRAPTGTTTKASVIKDYDTDQDNTNDIAWSNLNNIAFGGNFNVLYAKIVVDEGTGMKALTGTAGNVPTSTPVTISYKNDTVKYDMIAPIDAENIHTYYVGPIVMDTTALHEFKVTVEDAVGNKGYISRNIIIDNTAPTTISNVKPGKQEVVNGVVNFRGGMSDNENGSGIRIRTEQGTGVILAQDYGVEFFIPTDSQFNTYKNNPAGITSGWLKPTTKGSASWEIEFDNLGTMMGYNADTYSVSEDYDDYETIKGSNGNSGSGLYDIPVWFRLTDEVGNVGYNTANSIRYDPNADRPSVQITYPSHENGKEYIQMGGTITISGMANDDDGISSVYLQFDMDGDGTWENGVGIAGCPYETNGDENVLVAIPRNEGQQGILANGTKSWYYTINVSQLSGLKYDTDHKTLNVRAIAIEKDTDKSVGDYLYSAWSDTLHISINNTIPNFTNIKLKRFGTAPTASNVDTKDADAEQDYTPDMYLKGSEADWYFTGQVVVSGEAKVSLLTSTATGLITKKSADEKIMYFAIPISANNQNGGWSTNLHTEDNTSGTPNPNNYNGILINIDSQAPEFPDTKTVNSNTEIKLYKGDYGKTELSSANKVQDSNSWFAFAGKITETGSGFSRLAFYYERKGAGSDLADRVYNPMVAHGANNDANRANLSTDDEWVSGSVYLNDESLPALYITGATRSEENSITAAVLKDNANVRVGGLIKIGGVYRRIESIDDRDTDGKITFTPSCSTSYKIAEVIYAMVVDNTGESREGNTIKLDDGDGMVESYQKSGSNYIWDATISSKNIPDGPIEIHCVAFDVAGNSAHGYTTTSVSNNPPRITKVMFGTDLNSDTYYNLDTEFQSWYALEGNDTTKGTDKWDLEAKIGTKYFKAKKDLVVIPEFVGGSGTIYYMYSKGNTGITEAETGTLADNEADPPVAATIAALAASHANIVTNAAPTTQATLTATADTDNKIGVIVLVNGANDGLGTISTSEGEDGTNVYRFSFWDSTESCTPGKTSQWTVLNATFTQDLVDNTPPTGFITPFYWRSKDDASVIYTGGVAQGHIELEGDLPAETFTAGATDKEMDRDPKVSGKIKIEGTAFDETMLETVKLTFDNKSVTATYNPKSNPKWSYETNGADFTLDVDDDKGPTQDGHSVTWTYTIDSSKASAITGTERVIKVEVNDASSENDGAGNSNTPGTTSTSTETLTGYYKVDVVPYITGVYRNSSFNTNRARSGAVSLLRGEGSNTITGFNLNGGTTTGNNPSTSVQIVPDKKATETAVPMSDTTISGSNLTFTVPAAGSKSGYLHIVVNGVAALNNMNGYVTYNTETNAKAFDHNELTDDRYVHIWRVTKDDTFKGSKNANYPAMSSSSDGTLYASFTNYGQAKSYYSKAFTGGADAEIETSATATGDVTTVYYGYDPSEDTDISVGADGKVNVFYNGNFHGGQSYSWDGTGPQQAGGMFVYDPDATNITYNGNSKIQHRLYRFELYTYDNELNQFKNVRVNRTYDSTNTKSYVNIVYYDKIAKAIKYSFATQSTSTITPIAIATGRTISVYGNVNGQRAYEIDGTDCYDQCAVYLNNQYRRLTRLALTNGNFVYYIDGYTTNTTSRNQTIYHCPNTNYYDTASLGIAWVTIDGEGDKLDTTGTTEDTNETFRFASDWSPYKLPSTSFKDTASQSDGTGESVALTATSDGYPVILYMDAGTGQLRVAFADSRTPTTSANWTVQGVFDSDDDNYATVSDYLSCLVNGNDLHIAFQNTKGQLVYGKGTYDSENSVYVFGESQVLDDSGMWIDMTMNGTTPYISYLSRVNSYDGMKIAFYDSTFDYDNNGVSEGGWETLTAAMDAKVTNIRTCIEPNAKANDGNAYTAAIGFSPGSDYRAAFYVGK